MLSVRWRPRALQSTLAGGIQHALKQALGGFVLEQAGAELAQHAVIKTSVGELEGEQVFPVDPTADRLGCLTVAQPLAELHERNQREAPWCVGRLTKGGVEVGEVHLSEHGAEPVAQEHIRVAAAERGSGNACGVVGHGRERLLRTERHGNGLRRGTRSNPLTVTPPADFANSVSFLFETIPSRISTHCPPPCFPVLYCRLIFKVSFLSCTPGCLRPP